ncbi:MAG: translation initiation factor IF-3 [Spirochaetales bacterium]|nr:translation initiation factor IF-3 [Spirochaetales bacterium]
MAVKDLRINEQIRVREVRLIDGEGEQRGIVPTTEAMAMAKEADLDLVEVAPTSRPPVCKLLNYGKYKYEQEKKLREAKKKQSLTKLKEVRMQPKIDKHDLDFKAKHVQQFLDAGNKCKVTIRFRGRELAHTELGKVVLDNLLKRLEEGSFNVDNKPQMEGRMMSMLLSPRKK